MKTIKKIKTNANALNIKLATNENKINMTGQEYCVTENSTNYMVFIMPNSGINIQTALYDRKRKLKVIL